MSVKKASIGRTLAPRAVDNSRRKIMSRRRHQNGQLVELKNGGWACRYYERGDGHRQRVQKFLGGRELTRRQANSMMQVVLTTVNQNPTIQPRTTTTFRVFAEQWLTDCENRKQRPIKTAVSRGWENILDNHLLPLLGDVPLADCGNRALRSVVEQMSKKKLSPSSIQNILLVAKMVRSSAKDDDGNELFPIKWNGKFIDAPVVDKRKQRRPSFTSEQVTEIVKAATGRIQMIAILLGATALRAGELLGLEVRHFDGTSVTVNQSAWGTRVQTPKTQNAYRVVDLHPDVSTLLKAYLGDRKTGFIFQSSGGRPLSQTNLLRREFHPVLVGLKIDTCGYHAFRRYRITHLRQSHCPDGLLKFWSGHADEDMSDHYDQSREDAQYRRDVAKAMGVGFDVPKTLTGKEKLVDLGVRDVALETVETC
jgi:integrase